MKVSEVVARSIVAEGVDSIFALMGDTNLHIFGALGKLESGPKVYNALHEQAAVAMGEGYARSTGKPALCAVTAGPGLMNAMTTLTNAARSNTPLVLIAGQHSRDDLDVNQWLDHEGTVRLSGAHYRPVASPEVAVDAFQWAFYTARAKRAPVVLDIPLNVQVMEYPWPFSYEPTSMRLKQPQRIHPDPEALEKAVELIAAAERPVILGGLGLLAADGKSEAIALARTLDALLATTLPTRGLFHDVQGNAGVAGLFCSPVAGELFAEADCVVAAGASLSQHTIEDGYLFPNARVVQIDVQPELVMGNQQRADVYVQGDAKVTLAKLHEHVAQRRRGTSGGTGFAAESQPRLESTRADWAVYEDEPGRADPREICSALDATLDDDVALCMDGGHFWSFPIMHMPKWRWPQVYAYHFGAIGIGFPTALGVAVANAPKATAFIGGDLGTMLNVHELGTLARYNLPILVVILNDAALGAEYHKLRAHDYDPMLGAEPDFEFARIAQAFGVEGVTVTSAGQLREAVESFNAHRRPFVVDVKISREVRSQQYRRLYFAEETPSQDGADLAPVR